MKYKYFWFSSFVYYQSGIERKPQTQVVKKTSLSIVVLAGTSTNSSRPQDTRCVFSSSLVKADIFRFTVLVTFTLTSSSSVRSMYSDIFRPPVNPRLSKDVSVLLWARTSPLVCRLKRKWNGITRLLPQSRVMQ